MPDAQLIIVVDPGETTGLLAVKVLYGLPTKVSIIYAEEIDSPITACDTFHAFLSNSDSVVFIYEDYIIAGPASRNSPIEIIGVIKYFAHLFDQVKLVRQIPANQGPIKKFENLKDLFRKERHILSCVYHLFYYLIRTKRCTHIQLESNVWARTEEFFI